MTFTLYYMGGEQAGWRTVLQANGVTALGVSYWSLRKRLPKRKSFSVAEMFQGFDSVLLESGGFQANEKPEQLTIGEWQAYAAEYEQFVADNIDAFTLVTEFDAQVLGPAWVAKRRDEFYADIREKVLPVWHPSNGSVVLPQLAAFSGQISVVSSLLMESGASAETPLRVLADAGVRLHGSALTKPEIIDKIPFTSAASSSWLSPTKYHGDTIVWDDRTKELKRFPLSQKNRARIRLSSYFREHGFDPDAILADDNGELTRLTLWSWQHWAEHVATARGEESYSAGVDISRAEADTVIEVVATQPEPVPATAAVELVRRDTTQLPVFALHRETDEAAPAGQSGEITTLSASGTSQRICDTCHLRDKCPGFQQGATCAYSLPVRLRTRQEMRAMLSAVVEMQVQRVAFGRFVEERSGGYPDANVSAEVDRLFKISQIKAEIEDDSDKFEMTLRGRSSSTGGGAFSRFFGAQVGAATSALPTPVDAEETDRIIDGMIGP